MFPRATGVSHVAIGRRYKASSLWVGFCGLKLIEFSIDVVQTRIRKILPIVEVAAEKLDADPRAKAKTAMQALATSLAQPAEATEWARAAQPALAAFRKTMLEVGISLAGEADSSIGELEKLATQIVSDGPAWKSARTWAAGRLPIFVYLDDYPQLVGHQNIASYIARKTANPSEQTDADRSFEKMCNVADLSPEQLHKLNAENGHETRNQLVNRAGAVVTSELRRLWKDRPLKVRFSLDGDHLDTLISDPNSDYDVEVNLDERSRGLKWFFSFYITFSADTKGGPAENAMLLLDEPGLFLHALSQGDLLRHLSADFSNQIIYTTHSPFMVPTENLDAIRTVNIDQDLGTTVSNSPTGDSRTLFPLQAALGFTISQSLFVGPDNLIVEGVTDFWILKCVSDYLADLKKPGLPAELTITPAGGAPRVSYMVALLSSENLRVLVLLDDEKGARGTKAELVKQKLIREDNVAFVSDGFSGSAKPSEADIEDLIDSKVYDALVQESYKSELAGKNLAPNASIPRVVKRYEKAFEDIGLGFHKTRPARLLLTKMASDPQAVATTTTLENFARLFERISQRHAKEVARAAQTFRRWSTGVEASTATEIRKS